MSQATQPDPIGLAGGLNLYGYAGGDPINHSDPFGLRSIESEGADGEGMSDDDPCKRDADSQACKNFREADALATEFESVCRADSRELVASLATTGLGVGIVETGARLFKATRVATGVPSGRLGLQAAAAGPVGVMQAFGAGDTTYNNAGVNRAKAVLGFVPGVAPVVDFIEAASSCRDARVWRGRVNAMR